MSLDLAFRGRNAFQPSSTLEFIIDHEQETLINRNHAILYNLLQNVSVGEDSVETATCSTDSIRSLEVNIARIVGLSPAILDPVSSVPLNSGYMLAAFAIQTARTIAMLAHLSQARLGQLSNAAEDTTRLVQRMKLSSGTPVQWADDLRSHSTAQLCLHLWRCQMVLLLDRKLEAASILMHASATISEHKAIGRSCALSLAHFMDQLVTLSSAGLDPRTDIRILSLVKEDLNTYTSQLSLPSRLPDGGISPISVRRGSSDETAYSDMREDSLGEDEWAMIEQKLLRLQEAYETDTHSATSPRTRMQISNIIR